MMRKRGAGGAWVLEWSASIPLPFNILRHSEYQNTTEIMAVMVGLIFLARHGVRDVTVSLEGDSVSALEWATQEKYRIGASRATVVVLIEVCRKFGFRISRRSKWICSADNWRCDALSRCGVTVDPATLGFELGSTFHRPPYRGIVQSLDTLLHWCDPRHPPASELDISRLWHSTRAWLEQWDLNRFSVR